MQRGTRFDFQFIMRPLALLILVSLIVGCAAKPQAARRSDAPSATLEPRFDDAISATALVFDPPIAMNEPELDLGRDARERSAFVGYDQLTTTFFYLRTDDKQRFDDFHSGDRFERRAISERFGVSFR